MKTQNIIIAFLIIAAVVLVYIVVIKPALANVNTIAKTSDKANNILNIFGL